MDKEDITKERLNLSIWKDFFEILRPYKIQFLKIVGMMVFVGAMDAIFPLLSKYAIDNFVEKSKLEGLLSFGLIFLIAALTFSISIYLFIALAGKLETQMAYDIRKLGFEKLQTLSLSYYDNKAVGWLMSRMTSDIQKLSETISWGLVDFSWGITMMLGVTIAMLILNWQLALITLIVVPFVALISIYFQKRILNAQRVVRKNNSQITAAFNEDIQGAKTTKTLVREDINLKEFSELTSNMKKNAIKATVLSSIYLPLVLLLGSIVQPLLTLVKLCNKRYCKLQNLVAFISYTF